MSGQKPDRRGRILAYCRDMRRSIGLSYSFVKPGSYVVWTVGNRRIGGRPMPIDSILLELSRVEGATVMAVVHRDIPSKRMPLRNNTTRTMTTETILIMRTAV